MLETKLRSKTWVLRHKLRRSFQLKLRAIFFQLQTSNYKRSFAWLWCNCF